MSGCAGIRSKAGKQQLFRFLQALHAKTGPKASVLLPIYTSASESFVYKGAGYYPSFVEWHYHCMHLQ